MYQFTLDQKKAHDPWRHIAITANAGSGKTRVLVSRYCDIVELFGAWPDDIAAITFTEKAASELRGRIAAELERRLSNDDHRENWGRLKIAREKFPSAIVSTIHGFCSQMLREFPIETDVPPNFSVVSGYERRRMSEDALMEAIETALADSTHPDAVRSYDLARRIGREKMELILRMMLDNREIIHFSEISGVLALPREETLERWRRRLDAVVRGMLLNAETIPAITAMIDMVQEEKRPEVLDAFAAARDARSADELLPRMRTLRDLLLTADGGPRKRMFDLKGDDFIMLEGPLSILGATFKRAARFFDASCNPELHARLLDDSRMLLGIYHDALDRYDRRKDRYNALDFEDLQLRLLRALRDEESRQRIARRFRYLMIDEFQDTNELQYALAWELLDRLEYGFLCIVGDRKQSIYGFRNADVEVFARASEEIRIANRERRTTDDPLVFRHERIEPESRDEMLGVIKLAASFRLLPSICAYVNAACAPLLQLNPGSPFGVEYEDLVCARRPGGGGRVEFIIAAPEPAPGDNSDEGERCDPTWCPEAEMIARRLLGIVATGREVVWETPPGAGEERPRPARFGDMAILCRKRSHFPAIEAALRKYGVPFVTHGGTGFYRTQEIYDVLNYLRTLLNSRDDMALLGVLRSPFFGVSDAELFRLTLRENGGGHELWSRAKLRVASGKADDALRRGVETIEDDRRMAGRIPVALLLKRIIERTGLRGAVIGAERGEQNLANIDKLLEMARDYEARGFTNLFDFVERITEMVELEELEGEAPINTGRDALRLMTMHAAKGLEFPIVVLPSLHAPPRLPSEPFFDKELGFAWNWKFNHDEFRPAVTALMGLRASERERAEESRLFYVSLTRARDMLLISGEYDRNRPPAGTMLEWAIAPLGGIPEQNSVLRLHSPGLRFLASDGAGEYEEPWEQEIAVHLDIEDLPRYDPFSLAPVPFRSDAVRIGELPARAEGELYSATQFLIYNQCPTKYYLHYRLGIPQELGAAYDLLPETRDVDDGTTFAGIFRRAALRIDGMIDPATGLPSILRDDAGRTAMERIIDEAIALEPLLPDERERIHARMLGTFQRICTSATARALLFPAGARGHADYELRMPYGTEFLLGVIDRVVENADGEYSVLQYKTRRIEQGELERAAGGYLPQLRFYAYLISALNPQQRSIQATILFTEFPDAPQSFTFSRFETTRIGEELRSAVDDIRALTYSGRRELPLRTPHCPDCPYWIEERCLLARGMEEGWEKK